MQDNREFTIWAASWIEAEFAADTLDENMEQYGAGPNAFHVSIIPDFETIHRPISCPFDTCYLTDAGAAEIMQAFVVV